MSNEMIGAIGLIAAIVFMFLKIPLGVAFAIIGGIGTIIFRGYQSGFNLFAVIPFSWTTSYSFACLPMFCLMGVIVAETGIAKDLYTAAYKWFGNLPGGLAMTTLIVAAFFSAISGSAIAATATISLVCYPEMKRYHYSPALASGVITAGATMDIMIPPSIPMIIYSMIAEVSVGKMFFAGFGPGLAEVLIFIVIIYIMVKRKPSLAPLAATSFTFMEKVKGMKTIIPVAVIFLLCFGGMYGGAFTPTEAGAIGVATTVVVCVVMKRLTRQGFMNALSQSVRLTGRIFMVIIGTILFSSFMTLSGLSEILGKWVVDMGLHPMAFMLIVLLLYLLMGAFMDELCMMLLTLPFFLPAAHALGIDPIFFGVLVILAWQIGFIAPPVGMLVFVTKSVLKDEVSIGTIYKGCLPFLAGLVIVELLVIFVPELALFPTRFM